MISLGLERLRDGSFINPLPSNAQFFLTIAVKISSLGLSISRLKWYGIGL